MYDTAKLAKDFASKFHSGLWGKAARLTYDNGKGSLTWQKYIRLKNGFFDEEAHLKGKAGQIPHAVHGVKLVEDYSTKDLVGFWDMVLPGIILDYRIGRAQTEQARWYCSFN